MEYTPFRPVRCSESQLAGMAIIDGYIYFTLDTGRIYIDQGKERRLVGGGKGASVYYASSPNIEQNEQKYYIITPDMLEDSTINLAEGDIIINIDGSFYKVFEVNKLTNEIWCDRIAVSGSGDGGDTSFAKKISVKISSPSTTNLINGQSFSVEVSATSAVSAGGEVQDGKLQLFWDLSEKNASGDFIVYHKKTVDIDNNAITTLEIGTLMRENSTVRFSVYAKGVNSGESAIKYIDFTTSNLSLEPAENFSNLNLFDSSNVTVQCNVVGNTDKLLYIYWDETLLDDMPKKISATATALQTQSVPAAKATHGRHTVRIEVYQDMNGTNGLKAGELSYEIAIKAANDTTPIIWCNGYKSSYYDYETIQIPFQVYDPTKSTAEVILYKNNKEIGTRQITRNGVNPSFEIWEIVDADVDSSNSYAIVCGEDERSDRYEINFEVVETDKLKLAFPEALVLKFDATGRSNSESATNREIWSNPVDNYSNYKGSFTNFNWYNNGWITDDDNKTHLRISNGAKFGINFDPMVFSTGIEGKNSWTVEMQFKVFNLKNYQSLITNYTRYPGDTEYWNNFRAQMLNSNGYTNYDAYLRYILGDATDTFCENIDHIEKIINTDAAICKFYANDIGFCLGPQDAFFTTKNDTVSVSYVEDQMINIAIVFQASNQFISIYLNGVLTGIAKSTVGNSFSIDSNMIEFNSDYCDVNLYKFRIYNTNLAVNYIDLNLAADKKDIDLYDQTNLALYNSNLNEYQFDYDSMLEYNKQHPDNMLMPYVIWTTHGKVAKDNRLPWSKDQDITASMEFHNVALDRAYITGQLNDLAEKDGLKDIKNEDTGEVVMTAVQQYYLHHCPSWHGDNINMSVQGTSSQFYPRRNYKCKTKTAGDDGKKVVHMYMNEGPFEGTETQTDWFYFDNYTVGANKFTMKIDYMESSGSYNVGFANLVNNAYGKHPLDDYNKAGAFQILDSESTIEEEATEYSEGTVYTYYNHKGNPKQTNDPDEPDNIKLTSKEDFDLGPYALYKKLMQEDPTTYTKMKVVEDTTSPRYNKWYIMVPGYKTYSIPDTQNYRTSVQGFPVLAFHKREDTGEIKYIGRYNMILDKGADEAYGFAIDGVYQKFAGNKELPKVAECWEFSDNIGTFCSFRDPQGQDELTFKQVLPSGKENLTEYEAPIVANSFEYRYHYDADDIDIVYKLSKAEEKLNDLIKNQGIVNSGSEDNKELARNWLLEKMKHWEKACAWVWSTCTDVVPAEKEIATAIEKDDWSQIESLYKKTKDKLIFVTPKIYNGQTYQYDSKECRLAKFKAELADHFDIDYTTTYFVMTEVFECYDSRGKNAMMASWGPLKEGGDYIWYPIFYDIDTQLGINNTGIPSFSFDIDATKDGFFSTNNSVLWKNFYECFQDSYILQKYKQLKGSTASEIDKEIFGELKTPPLDSIERIERWYLADPDECGRGLTRDSDNKRPFLAMKGQRPLIALNLDEYYKYITITNSNIDAGGGYLGDGGDWISDSSGGEPIGTRFFALQGDRSLSRQQFLTNRINYIDSWLKVGDFQRNQGSDSIVGRISANQPQYYPDLWVGDRSMAESDEGKNYNLQYSPYWKDEKETEKTNEFDAEYWITLTPAKNVYVSIGLDNDAIDTSDSEDTMEEVSTKYTGTPIKITFPVDIAKGIKNLPNKDQQLLYIYASSQLTDLGDMSKLYFSEFNMGNNCKKLTRLLLGNDNFDCLDNTGAKRGYYRIGAQKLGLKDMPLLQEMCLSGIRTSNTGGVTYNLSSSEKLKSFRALRTDVTNVTFAKGVALDTLYLPEGIVNLKLTEARQLTNLLTEYPVTKGENVGEYNCQKGLYIEKLFDDESSTTNINNVTLIGDKLGYDSFILINQICKANKKCQITIEGVDWCPYKLIDAGTVYNADERNLYFKDNRHYGFEAYEYTTPEAWNLSITNGELYKLNEEILNSKSDKLTSCELLEKMVSSENYTSATEDSEIPTLKGIVFIKNIDAVEEDYIHDDLQVKYPDLQFFFENVNKAYSAEFIQQEDDGIYEVLASQKINPDSISSSWFVNPYTNYKEPKKLDYDFIGWATDPEGKNILGTKLDGSDAYSITDEEWLALKEDIFNAETFDYVFYAIFILHKYEVRFLDGDGTDLIEPLAIAYGEKIGSLAPIKIPYLNDEALPLIQTYSFVGYKTSKASTKTVDLTKYIIRNDTVFYPSFEAVNVYDNIHPEYFYRVSSVGSDGIVLGLKAEVQGKITIPAKFKSTSQGKEEVVKRLNVTFASSLEQGDSTLTPHGKYLTHVFFERGTEVEVFEENCFKCANYNDEHHLKYVEFPASLQRIREDCFEKQSELDKSMLTNLASSNVIEIGANAFAQAFGGVRDQKIETVSEINISGRVSTLNEAAFSNLGIIFESFTIGAKKEPSQWSLPYKTNPVVHTGRTGTQYKVSIYSDSESLTVDKVKPYFSNFSSIEVINP